MSKSDGKEFFSDPKSVNEELPEIGKRVRVLCIKEMIYIGNCDAEGSDWIDDGQGERFVLFWENIHELWEAYRVQKS